MIEVNKRIHRPEPLLELFTRNDLAGALQQHRQDLQRLHLQLDLATRLVQFSGTKVHLEHIEPEYPRSSGFLWHTSASACDEYITAAEIAIAAHWTVLKSFGAVRLTVHR